MWRLRPRATGSAFREPLADARGSVGSARYRAATVRERVCRGLLAIILLALAGCQRYPSGGDVLIRSDMVDQPSFRPQEDPRPLAEGAIPAHAWEPPITQAEAERSLRNPVPATDQTRAQGRKLFNIYCAPCHGVSGRGDGPVAPKMPKPADLLIEEHVELSDGFIYYIIRYGTPLMPSKADVLEPMERWQVIHYLRALQRR